MLAIIVHLTTPSPNEMIFKWCINGSLMVAHAVYWVLVWISPLCKILVGRCQQNFEPGHLSSLYISLFPPPLTPGRNLLCPLRVVVDLIIKPGENVNSQCITILESICETWPLSVFFDAICANIWLYPWQR